MYVEFFGPGASGKTTSARNFANNNNFVLRSKNPFYYLSFGPLLKALKKSFLILGVMFRFRFFRFVLLKELFLCFLIYYRYENKNYVSDHGFLHTIYLHYFSKQNMSPCKISFFKFIVSFLPNSKYDKYFLLIPSINIHKRRLFNRMPSFSIKLCSFFSKSVCSSYESYAIFLSSFDFVFERE